jgi:hypothetical protein
MTISANHATATFGDLDSGVWSYSVKVNTEKTPNGEDFLCWSMEFDYKTYRTTEQILLNNTVNVTTTEPITWMVYHSLRSSNGSYIFIPFGIDNFSSIQMELSFDLDNTPRRADLGITADPGIHQWYAGSSITLTGTENTSFTVSNKYCGEFAPNCTGSISGKQRFITLDFTSQLAGQSPGSWQNMEVYIQLSRTVFGTSIFNASSAVKFYWSKDPEWITPCIEQINTW